MDPAGKFYAINEQIPAVSDTNGCRQVMINIIVITVITVLIFTVDNITNMIIQGAICVLNSNGNAEILTASVG